MRVLLWSELFWPYLGGAEIFAARLMCGLRDRGHDFSVITSHDALELPDEARYRGIPVHRRRFREALSPHRLDALMDLRARTVQLVRETRPDVIHLNGIGPSAFFCLRAAAETATALLVRVNRDPATVRPRATNGAGDEGLTQQILRKADFVVGVSAATLAAARAVVPDIARHSTVIYNGVESAEAPPPPIHPPRVLCLGRLVPDKGFERAIAAFAVARQACPRARMTIAGDGPERAALAAAAVARGVAESIDFIGWVPPAETASLIRAASLVVLPSRNEGLPGVAIEAAVQGRAIIATRVGGLPEVVAHEETGILVDSDEELTDAMSRLLTRRHEVADFGAAAWRRGRQRFALDPCLSAYADLYRRLGRDRP